MSNKKTRLLTAACILLFLSVLFTVLVRLVDVQPIGPQDSCVGFAEINRFFHELTGVQMTWYHITDFLAVIPVCTALAFAVIGLVQTIQRRSLLKVDKGLLLLGLFYIFTVTVYVFFECCVINYRPILMDGVLEASYPSSHTMLSVFVMSTAIPVAGFLFKSKTVLTLIRIVSVCTVVLIVLGRLLSGVHWLTDILGGVLIGSTLSVLYLCALQALPEKVLTK